MNPLASFSKPFWSSTLASGWSARAAAMASWTVRLVGAGGEGDQTRRDELRAGEGVLLGDAEDEVVADPALAVVDRRRRAAGACRSRRTPP